jgi:hypothetical protein
LIATAFNLYIPRTDRAAAAAERRRGAAACATSRSCNARLWADKLGQISLATTTLLWGVFGNLRLIVFAWAAAALGYSHGAGLQAGRRRHHRFGGRRGRGLDDAPAGPRHRRHPAGHRWWAC